MNSEKCARFLKTSLHVSNGPGYTYSWDVARW